MNIRVLFIIYDQYVIYISVIVYDLVLIENLVDYGMLQVLHKCFCQYHFPNPSPKMTCFTGESP
jgi:hypothetical protein